MHLGYVGVALYRQGQKKAGIKKIKRHLAYGKKFWFGEKSRPKFFKVLVSLNLQKNTVKGYQEAWKYWNASCEAETDNYLSYLSNANEANVTLEGTGAEPERAWGSANMHNERRVNQVRVYFIMLNGFIRM